MGPRPASHKKENSTSVYYLSYIYIYNNWTAPKQKQIDKKSRKKHWLYIGRNTEEET